MDKIIKVNFEEWQDAAYVDEKLVAWNYGQILQVEGLTLPDGNIEVDFSLTDREGDANVYMGSVKDNILTVGIPNFIFQKENVFQPTYDAYAFIYQTDEESGRTIKKITFTIQVRPKPTTDVPDDQKDLFLEEVRQVLTETKEIAQSVRDDADTGVFDGPQGPKGDSGSIEFKIVNELPTEDISESTMYLVALSPSSENNEFAEYIYVEGHWEYIGSATVEVDLLEYVKFTDYSKSNKAGVVKTNAGWGLQTESDGALTIVKATKDEIVERGNAFKPIVPSILDYAVMVALTNPKKHTWTDEQKQLARALLGSVGVSDYATSTTAGVVKAVDANGIKVAANGLLSIAYSSKKEIDTKEVVYKPITPKVLDYAVKKALSDCKLSDDDAWTEEEKAKALELLGGVKKLGDGKTNFIYGEYWSGSQVMIPFSETPIPYGVLRSYIDGRLRVGEPVEDADATTKKYVDDLVGSVETILTELHAHAESLIGGEA